jgi:hypothetical protein
MSNCYLCQNEATYIGWTGPPDERGSKQIYVCGLHSSTDDERIGEDDE